MRRLLSETKIDFLARRRQATILSGVLLAVALLALLFRGLVLGIDFTGGSLIEVGYPQAVELEPIREALGQGGFEDAVVQHFGSARDVLIRIGSRPGLEEAQISTDVVRTLQAAGSAEAQNIDLRRVEFVGPQVGEELTEDGGMAMLIALFAIFIYVALRFEWKFSLGAVAALFHDVIITMGFFAITGLEFDLPVLAAVLAVIGYSLNDTIVVYDRIRENFRRVRRGTPKEVINTSLNQTLSRTMITSLTTLLVLFALVAFGGELIRNFAIALIVGVVIGTYSSIFVASSLLQRLGVSKQDLMPVEKEGADAADLGP